MTGFFRNARLGKKLPIVMGSLVALTILVMSGANALMTRGIIAANAEEKLAGIALLKSERVGALLAQIDQDIRLRAAEPATSVALIALADGYNAIENPGEVLRRVYIEENPHPLGEKDQLVKADTGSSYGFIHAVYHPTFDTLQDEMDYYDVFLFDTEGNLVYSVFKENDYATNMLDGPWADSGLAEAYRLASVLGPEDPSAFVDFAPYEPSFGAPAAFISRPVFNDQGTRIGVLAYQMPVTKINAAAGNLKGLGASSDGFIVGRDLLMRTDSARTEDVDTLSRTVEHDGILGALDGQNVFFDATGHDGQRVLGFAAPIEFLGKRWVTVVQQDHRELFSGLRAALYQAIAISVAILAGAIAVSVFLSRSISRPMLELTEAVREVAEGTTEIVVPGTDRGDEIGELARKTEVFRQNAEHIARMVEEQKQANAQMIELNAEREKSREREAELAREKEEADRAAEATRQEMLRKLGSSIGDVVQAARNGEFSNRIDATFDDDVLNELSSNINDLMSTVDDGLSKTGSVLGLVAKGDLTHRMTGEFSGAFRDLQGHVNNMLDSLTSLVSEIAESGATLSESASELRQTADTLSRQAEQNAASVEETSAALEQLTASMTQVDKNLEGVRDNARDARATATESERVASEAATSMDRIANGSKEINRVTQVINDIAFQINLLALNAGVEAARAGDAGRGFSVVASEVRQLAQRAGEAAKEIAQVLSQSDAAVNEGVENVSNAKASLDEISRKVISISESVEDVTRAISEQASGIKEISSAVSQVDSNTQKQAAAFEEVTASSHLLANEAGNLQQSTARFRIANAPVARSSAASIDPRPARPALAPAPAPAAAVGAEAFDEWDEF